MIRRVNEEEVQETEKMRSQWMLAARSEWNQNRFKTVMDSIDADEAMKQELLYADMVDVVWKYQVERDDVLQLRKLAQDAGMYMMAQGINQAIS